MPFASGMVVCLRAHRDLGLVGALAKPCTKKGVIAVVCI